MFLQFPIFIDLEHIPSPEQHPLPSLDSLSLDLLELSRPPDPRELPPRSELLPLPPPRELLPRSELSLRREVAESPEGPLESAMQFPWSSQRSQTSLELQNHSPLQSASE